MRRWPRWSALSPRARTAFFIAVLVAFFSFLFLSFPDLVRDFLVDPALRVFLILDSFPQGVVWIFVVGILLFLSLQLMRQWPRERRRVARPEKTRSSRARELLLLLRRAQYSPWARRALRHRLARILVALRTERELVSSQQAWEELWAGKWPGNCALGRFLRGEDARDFMSSIKDALEELFRYAQGGDLDH